MNVKDKLRVTRVLGIFILWCFATASGVAEGPPEKGGPRPEGGPPGGSGSGGPGPGPGPRREWGDRERMDSFKRLSEEERTRVRSAFEKAWNDTRVTEARAHFMKANDEYRETLHEVLRQIDPGIEALLEKSRPPMPDPMPEPEDPDFPKKALARLAMEVQMWAKASGRDADSARIHEKMLGVPAVAEALRRLNDAPVSERKNAWKGLRESYVAAARQEGLRVWDRGGDGFRREGGNFGPGGPGMGRGPGGSEGPGREREPGKGPPGRGPIPPGEARPGPPPP